MSEKSLSEAEYDAITDAAAHWCMRMHASDCTSGERQAFQQWHDAHPLHAFEYAAMLEIWDVADHLPRNEAASAGMPLKPRSRLRTYAVAAAISLAALPLLAFTGWEAGWLPSSYERFEATNGLRQVTLGDGSQVELNLGTELVYSHYKDQRQVTLKKGEAFFKVSHDRAHPFIVRAGEGQVRVTGTQFNVWKYDDQVRVMLLEGSVQISSDKAHGSVPLTPGMQASYQQGDATPRISSMNPNDSALAWRQGKLVLDNLALADALPLINRYLNKPVMLADANTGAIRIGGIYNTSEVNSLIPSLPKVLPVYLTQNQDGNPVLNAIPRKAPKG
ncbi:MULTISPECIES: FecR family protein [unclassified Pseudomonas]|jgi:transmembrane sensor|uniref:Peptide ABC transporter substrate-binding protein n=1 Tax=Pseudomonas gorinensis TaxID=3240790 RepID=A0ACA7P8M5_9PSED|nr:MULTISPECIES: FecR family protein [unclassified Pseudomonas]AHC36174.1 peptide ABC transporter substrate-binding protein [Pseudomonas sp. TKP]MBL1309405.1 FecR family protein [Pseudomonas sp.]PMX09040.1 FecR family protein [Pseudomonas sp. MPBC4-3]PMX45166.1 FecR family protein [Pseudomonas sp. FW301-21B01]PMY04332.1 FecR family protein [Pseudomonas sp. MPR-R5A]